MEGTEPTEEKKAPIDQQLKYIQEQIADVRTELLDALNKGFSDIKKILTSETW